MATQPLTPEEVDLEIEIEVFTVAGGNDLPIMLGHVDKTTYNKALARLTPNEDPPGYHAAVIRHRWITFGRHQEDCDAEPVLDPEDPDEDDPYIDCYCDYEPIWLRPADEGTATAIAVTSGLSHLTYVREPAPGGAPICGECGEALAPLSPDTGSGCSSPPGSAA